MVIFIENVKIDKWPHLHNNSIDGATCVLCFMYGYIRKCSKTSAEIRIFKCIGV